MLLPEPIKNLDELIHIFGDLPEFTRRLQVWQALRDEVTQALSAFESWQAIEHRRTQAEALLQESRDVRRLADEYAAKTRHDADQMGREAQQAIDREQARLVLLETDLQAKQQTCAGDRQRAAESLKAAQAMRQAAQEVREQAMAQMGEAQRLQAQYTERSQALQKALAG